MNLVKLIGIVSLGGSIELYDFVIFGSLDEGLGRVWFEMIFRFSDHQNARLSEEVLGRVWFEMIFRFSDHRTIGPSDHRTIA